MEEIQNTIDTFDRLRKYQYKIVIENGMEIVLRFSRERYHHLAGFQHLTGLDDVANPHSKQEFNNNLKKGKASVDRIKKSCQYDVIRERIESFGMNNVKSQYWGVRVWQCQLTLLAPKE